MEYKLGELVEQVTETNTELNFGLNDIIGVTIDKKIIPTIANLKETDLKKFVIVSPNDFIYNPRTHGKKIGLGYNNADRKYIATWNNNTFRIKTEKRNTILSDYLYLYFNREIWDKEACFNSWGSSTVVFSWDSFCDMKINLPDIEEQKKIVKEYWAITEQIVSISKENIEIQKLGVLDLCNVIGFESLVNKTDNELSEFNLPKNCSISTVKDFCKKITSGGTPNRANPEYYNGSINWLKSGEVHNNIITRTEENISELGLNNSSAKIFPRNTVLMAMYGVTAGEIGLLDIETSTNQAICGMICNNIEDASFLYFTLRKNQIDIKRLANGGAQNNLNQETIKATKIIIPNEIAKKKLHCSTFMNRLIINSRILYQLQKMLDLLLLKIH